MVSYFARQRLIIPIAPAGAVAAAVLVAAAAVGVPRSWLDFAVVASGLAAIFPAAEPPLGLTARLALMVTGGSAAGTSIWFLLNALFGVRALTLRLPLPARRDVHPDAPKRGPLLATRELGTPFHEVKAKPQSPAERSLPRNLDAPLAHFDPGAIPAAPAAPVPLVKPLIQSAPAATLALAAGERLQTFELTTPIAAPDTDATIHALLARLERGVANRHRATAGLDSALGELRRLAAG